VAPTNIVFNFLCVPSTRIAVWHFFESVCKKILPFANFMAFLMWKKKVSFKNFLAKFEEKQIFMKI
jgi:hypothetical protein